MTTEPGLVLADDFLLQHVAAITDGVPGAPDGTALIETLCGVTRWAPTARMAPVHDVADISDADRMCPACATALRLRTTPPASPPAETTASLLDLLETTP